MARIFAGISSTGLRLNIFDGATGEIISDHALPDNLLGQGQVDVSFDGRYVAVLAGSRDYVWFHDRQTGDSGSVTLSGTIGFGRGFDGAGAYYVGGYQQYRKFLPPFSTSELVGTPGVAYTLYPAPVPDKAVVLERDPSTGDTRFIRFDLTTGVPGPEIGNRAEQGPLFQDKDAAYVFTGIAANYGFNQWDYFTADPVQAVGPSSGAGGYQQCYGAGFTDDGARVVLKVGDNALGVGNIGGGGVTQVSLTPVLEYSADNAYAIMEGMVSDQIAVLSGVAIRNMLVGFDITTGQVVWQNSLGSNQSNGSFGDPRSLGVQGLAAGYVPPQPPAELGFWINIVQAAENV